MAQSTGMSATSAAEPGAHRRAAVVLAVAALAAMVLAPLAARAAEERETEPTAASSTPADRVVRSASREAAERRLRARAYADDEGDGPGASMGFGSLLSGRSGLIGTAGLAFAFYLLFMRGRGGAGSGTAGWGSYYLFWIVAPALLAAVSSHPAFLIIIVVGLVARRWLPDPFLFLKHQGRVRSLQADIDANASNVTARRDLAKIWLEKHRPRRALPLLDQAIARDPDSIELLYLSGVAHLLAGNHENAVTALVTVVHREPNFLYGEAYLRAADALMALGRWDDADDALERHVKINSSSLEGRFKRVRVCKARNDAEGMREAHSDLREVWRALPSYQRRKQFGWYLRSLV
jgi:tetratricopeptide (TPR) repeat protein